TFWSSRTVRQSTPRSFRALTPLLRGQLELPRAVEATENTTTDADWCVCRYGSRRSCAEANAHPYVWSKYCRLNGHRCCWPTPAIGLFPGLRRTSPATTSELSLIRA